MNYFPQHQPDIEQFTTPYFFFSGNANAEITYVSASVEKVLGYKPVEVYGRSVYDFLKSNDEVNQDFEACKSKRFGQNFVGEHHKLRAVLNRNGERRVLLVQTVGCKNELGQIIAVQGLAQDITRQYQVAFEMWSRLEELKALESKLSGREKEVLAMMVQGKLNKIIARELSVTERTIENVRARLKAKLQVESIAQVAAIATELKILPTIVDQLLMPMKDLLPTELLQNAQQSDLQTMTPPAMAHSSIN